MSYSYSALKVRNLHSQDRTSRIPIGIPCFHFYNANTQRFFNKRVPIVATYANKHHHGNFYNSSSLPLHKSEIKLKSTKDPFETAARDLIVEVLKAEEEKDLSDGAFIEQSSGMRTLLLVVVNFVVALMPISLSILLGADPFGQWSFQPSAIGGLVLGVLVSIPLVLAHVLFHSPPPALAVAASVVLDDSSFLDPIQDASRQICLSQTLLYEDLPPLQVALAVASSILGYSFTLPAARAVTDSVLAVFAEGMDCVSAAIASALHRNSLFLVESLTPFSPHDLSPITSPIASLLLTSNPTGDEVLESEAVKIGGILDSVLAVGSRISLKAAAMITGVLGLIETPLGRSGLFLALSSWVAYRTGTSLFADGHTAEKIWSLVEKAEKEYQELVHSSWHHAAKRHDRLRQRKIRQRQRQKRLESKPRTKGSGNGFKKSEDELVQVNSARSLDRTIKNYRHYPSKSGQSKSNHSDNCNRKAKSQAAKAALEETLAIRSAKQGLQGREEKDVGMVDEGGGLREGGAREEKERCRNQNHLVKYQKDNEDDGAFVANEDKALLSERIDDFRRDHDCDGDREEDNDNEDEDEDDRESKDEDEGESEDENDARDGQNNYLFSSLKTRRDNSDSEAQSLFRYDRSRLDPGGKDTDGVVEAKLTALDLPYNIAMTADAQRFLKDRSLSFFAVPIRTADEKGVEKGKEGEKGQVSQGQSAKVMGFGKLWREKKMDRTKGWRLKGGDEEERGKEGKRKGERGKEEGKGTEGEEIRWMSLGPQEVRALELFLASSAVVDAQQRVKIRSNRNSTRNDAHTSSASNHNNNNNNNNNSSNSKGSDHRDDESRHSHHHTPTFHADQTYHHGNSSKSFLSKKQQESLELLEAARKRADALLITALAWNDESAAAARVASLLLAMDVSYAGIIWVATGNLAAAAIALLMAGSTDAYFALKGTPPKRLLD